MLWGVRVGEIYGLLLVVDKYQTAILQRFSGNLLAGQHVELTVDFSLYIEDNLLRGSD